MAKVIQESMFDDDDWESQLRHVHGQWITEATRKAYGVIKKRKKSEVRWEREFVSTDELWPHLSRPPEKRAIAVVMLNLQRRGVIACSKTTKRSTQGTNHNRPVHRWIIL